MTRAEVVGRARSQMDLKIKYKLGAGGFDPSKQTCAPAGSCDCSGFVAWCLGVPRKNSNPYYIQQNGGWFETTAVYRDAFTEFGFVSPTLNPKPGDLLVYPDRKGKQGHIGIVSNVDVPDNFKIIHCSSSNYRALGTAVYETAVSWFNKGGVAAVYCRVAWVE